jgi:hypothetical protein
LDEADTIILENLRMHGNNISARILQLKTLTLTEQWMDVRRLGFEAEDIINRLVAPTEGSVVAHGFKIMLNDIRNYMNNKIDGTEWKEMNENR